MSIVKVLLVVICGLVSVLVAVTAGILTRMQAKPLAAAILYAGAAFAASMTLGLGILSALDSA
ncbi:hypothetical protein ACFY2Z_28430 [Streptomyces sp. NPDC001222]|uniref:hypothetical protein n=1 Tax=Streptomyces sp. NPDC001222 TaxID=3364548 RepID=UPI003688D529